MDPSLSPSPESNLWIILLGASHKVGTVRVPIDSFTHGCTTRDAPHEACTSGCSVLCVLHASVAHVIHYSTQ